MPAHNLCTCFVVDPLGIIEPASDFPIFLVASPTGEIPPARLRVKYLPTTAFPAEASEPASVLLTLLMKDPTGATDPATDFIMFFAMTPTGAIAPPITTKDVLITATAAAGVSMPARLRDTLFVSVPAEDKEPDKFFPALRLMLPAEVTTPAIFLPADLRSAPVNPIAPVTAIEILFRADSAPDGASTPENVFARLLEREPANPRVPVKAREMLCVTEPDKPADPLNPFLASRARLPAGASDPLPESKNVFNAAITPAGVNAPSNPFPVLLPIVPEGEIPPDKWVLIDLISEPASPSAPARVDKMKVLSAVNVPVGASAPASCGFAAFSSAPPGVIPPVNGLPVERARPAAGVNVPVNVFHPDLVRPAAGTKEPANERGLDFETIPPGVKPPAKDFLVCRTSTPAGVSEPATASGVLFPPATTCLNTPMLIARSSLATVQAMGV